MIDWQLRPKMTGAAATIRTVAELPLGFAILHVRERFLYQAVGEKAMQIHSGWLAT
jgi:hypothetical protein